jgi:hypothetical protein
MSYVRLIVDGELQFEGDLNQWKAQPPQFIQEMADQLKPGALTRPQPHMLAVMSAFGTYVAQGADVVIEASTGPGWWSLNVKEQ